MKQQHGGTLLGLAVGLVIGLAIALVVAVYVTKVPIPFAFKGQSRTVEQDAAEANKNKGWDPNAPLQGKSAAQPAETRPVTDQPVSAPADKPVENKPAVSADPLGDLARAQAGGSKDPFNYFVQIGAFRTPEDAEKQRAMLSLTGVQAKVMEREQSGRMVYRVRVGPFERRDEAEKVMSQIDAAGHEAALVRVQR